MKLCKHGLKLVNGAKLENTQTENSNIKPTAYLVSAMAISIVYDSGMFIKYIFIGMEGETILILTKSIYPKDLMS